MKVLGFDLETTGLDTKTANILEVGAVRFDVTNGVWTPEETFSTLVYEPSYLPLPLDAMAKNGITEEMIIKDGVSFETALDGLKSVAVGADYVVAHNAVYDKSVFGSQLVRHSLISFVEQLRFLCSLNDVESFSGRKCRVLSHLCLDFGIIVDPSTLHRATDDVLLMGQLLNQVNADPESMWIYKNMPSLVLHSKVVKPWEDNNKDKEIAQAAGYRWEKAGEKVYPKKWVKLIKKNKLDLETRAHTILEEL